MFDRPAPNGGCINCGLPLDNGTQLLCLRCLSVPPMISAVERLALRRLADEDTLRRYAAEIPPALAEQVGNLHAIHAQWLHWDLMLRRQDPRAA